MPFSASLEVVVYVCRESRYLKFKFASISLLIRVEAMDRLLHLVHQRSGLVIALILPFGMRKCGAALIYILLHYHQTVADLAKAIDRAYK